MLEINPDLVCEIRLKLRAHQAKEQVSFPETGSNPLDELNLEVLADHQDDLTSQEVALAIQGLEPDQQMQLVALMWLGRGDFEAEEWEVCLAEARQRWTTHTADYLLSTPLVADFLEEGLEKLDYHCDDG